MLLRLKPAFINKYMKRLYLLLTFIFIVVLPKLVLSQCGIQIAPDTLFICAGDSVLISVTDTGNLNPFNWSPAAGLSATTGSNVWASPTFTTKYTVTKSGCIDNDSVVVVVNPLPVVTISGANSICAGSNVTYNAGGGFAGYLWSTGATTQTINVNTQNTYTVTVTDANGCSSSATKSLTVNSVPACSITGNSSNCIGSTVQWCAAAGMNSYSWSTGDTISCINISTAGTYTVTITGANGCTSSCQKVLNTNTLPTASITGDTLVCRFGQASITFTGANGTPPYTFAYKIDNGNVQTIATGTSTAVINPNTSVVGTSDYILISVTDANGCLNVQNDTVSLTVKKQINAQFIGSASVCKNDTSPLITLTGVNCSPPVTFTYTINQNDTFVITSSSIDTVIAAPTSTTGTYIYNLISVADTTCTNVINKYVVIFVNSLPYASISGTSEVCQFASQPLITFICDSGIPPYVVTYSINGGPPLTDTVGGSSISIGASTNNTGIYTYNLISVADAFGCSQGISGGAIITVDSLPVASISGSTSVCKNSAPPYITFTGTTGKKPYSFTYIINGVTNTVTSAPGNDTVNIPVSTSIAGTFIYYLVSVTDANGCDNSINNQSVTIIVNQLPSATINGTTGVCINGLLPAITFTGSGGLQDYTFTYNINGGGNQTITTSGSDTISITAPTGANGIYNYNLIDVSDANGCVQSITGTATVTVNPLPAATISGNISVCQNDPLPTVTFNGTIGTAPFSFTYSINDGINPPDTNTVTSNGTDSTKAITVPTNLAGNFTYQLISVQDANGCITALNTSVLIIINQLPSAVISGSTTVCKNDSAPLITFSGSAGIKPFQFIYNIGGGTNDSITVYTASDTSIAVSTSQAGTFVYNLIAVQDSNGCIQNINNQSATITINSLPTVTISGTTSVCHNSPVQPVITFTGASGTQPFTFVYNINGGPNDTITTSVNNIATVVALTTTVGIYTYNLVSVTDANGCWQAQTGVATITVSALPSATINGTATVCKNAPSPSVTFTGSNGTPPYSFTYNINNGINSTITTSGVNSSVPVSQPTFAADTFIYNLVAVTDANGCTDSITGSVTIIVNPLPVGSVAVSQDSICQNDMALPIITITGSVGPSPYTFTYNVNGGSSIIKSTSAGNDTIQIQVPTNVPPGIYNYNLTSVTDANGCSLGQSATIPVTINPLPVIQSSLPSVVLCHGDTLFVEAFASTVLNSIYNWSSTADVGFGTTGTGNIPNAPMINNDSVPLIATITVYATSPFGCIGPSSSFNITVNPKPILLSVDDTICSGQVFNNTLIPNFYNNIKYAWNSSVNPLIITGNTNQSASSNAVINDTLINHTTSIQTLPYSVSLIYTNGTHNCITTDTLNVTVKPAPPKPDFTSSVFPGNSVITLCKSSININFNVSNPDTAVTYTWIASPPAGVNFGNTLTPNTVASFDANAVSPVTIFAIADYAINTGACQDTASMVANLTSSANAIDPRVIFKKEPGHLLIYPDNSMNADSGYQWGYDSLFYKNNFNDTLTGPPVEIAGQVYQFFIPPTEFILNDSLNVHDYAYWVLLGNGECKSKVYYNGPYAQKPVAQQPIDNTVALSVYPNPTANHLNVTLSGNIYGSIEAKILNALGEQVFTSGFQKKQPEIKQLINIGNIPDGIYFLELTSSDHQRLTTRIIVNH